MKTTLVPGLAVDIYGYKRAHKEFPDETTSGQFFDEKQVEAYRGLGYGIAHQMLQDNAVKTMIRRSTLGADKNQRFEGALRASHHHG